MTPVKARKRQRAALWSAGPDIEEEKRARNRQSQRSFRERRSLRIKELEARVQYLSMGETERNDSLVSANSALKSALIRARQQFLQLEMTMQSLNKTLTTALSLPDVQARCPDITSLDETLESDLHPPPSLGSGESEDDHLAGLVTDQTSPIHQTQVDPPRETDYTAYDLIMPNFVDYYDEGSPTTAAYLSGNSSDSVTSATSSLRIGTRRDHVWPAADLFSRRPGFDKIHVPSSSRPCGRGPINSNYAFTSGLPQAPQLLGGDLALSSHRLPLDPPSLDSISGCVAAMEASLRSHIDSFVGHASETFLTRACLILMVYFTRYIWPGPSMMWFSSFSYSMAERSLIWRLSRAGQPHRKLPTYLTPTDLQLRTPHQASLSWIALPGLRDRLIRYSGSGQYFDRVWVDLMSHAVVEVEDISTILLGVEKGPGFLGVWNIFHAIDGVRTTERPDSLGADFDTIFQELSKLDTLGLLRIYRMNLPEALEASNSPAEQHGSWDAITSEQLFSDSGLARKLYYHLELYNAHKCWRIDPVFFEKYPLLKWDGYEKTVAHGLNLRMESQPYSLPSRDFLDRIFFQYQLSLMTMDPSEVL